MVETPEPDRLLDRLGGRLDGRLHSPLAVLDPGWPAALRRRALDELRAAVRDGRVDDDHLVLFTSGSSGRPKGVVRTVESWRASLAPLTRLTGATSRDTVWLPLPLTSGLSLYGGVHARSVGARVRIAPATQGVPPDATIAHVVPTVVPQICEAVEAGRSRLRTVVVAGAALGAVPRERAQQCGLDLVEYYGAAELSFVGWRRGDGPLHDFPGAEVRVADDLLWVRSPYVCRGYLDPETRGPLRTDGDWRSVGDRGRVDGDGWRVLGRGDAAVTTGGHTVVAEELEAAIGALAGVRDVAVVGRPHDHLGQVVTAVVVVDDGVSRAELALGLRHLPAWSRPVRWLRAGALPHTATGKLARAELAASLETLQPLS
ncbi:MAG TPA: class I adenylate-forming enzyme family protein [Angustibacter sp.]|nr:class I adenylate-forming enzyme family protein [Angustibacter sp.]